MMEPRYRVGIVGCGLIGSRRADVLSKFPSSKLLMVADVDLNRAKSLAQKAGCRFSADWKVVTQNADINLVIISTTNDFLAEATIDALRHQKHVLVEKPAGRNPTEINKIISQYKKTKGNLKIKVGYNHRFHPAFVKAKELIAKEDLGDIMFIRGRYGHGGRVGYDKEWRAFREKAGGGEMLDQGSHLIDICRYFMGEFPYVSGYCGNFFWNMEVEDNCFALLRTEKGAVAQLHASCTQWKNIHSVEIFLKRGQINIDGLGRSYGKETLTFYKMKPDMGIPETQTFSWETDDSWEKEYQELIGSIETAREPNGNIYDALEAIKIIYEIYRQNPQIGTTKARSN